MTALKTAMAILFALSLSAVFAQPPVATAPASQPAIEGLDGKIQVVIDRALEQYATLKSYEDSLVNALVLEVDGPDQLEAPEPRVLSLAYARPDRLALSSPIFQIQSDGNTLRESVIPWFQYIESPAPKPLHERSLVLARFPFYSENTHPLFSVLTRGGKPSLDFLGRVTRLDSVKAEALDGQPGHRVIGKVHRDGIDGDLTLELWFSDKTGLLGEIIYDQTESLRAIALQQGIKLKKYLQRYRFNDVRLNEAIAEDRFALQEQPTLEKVAKLTMPTAQEMQERLRGRPAIEFTGKDLDGKPVTSADLKGRVIMLDFWSIRCGPCIMSMPTLQKVADKFADKPVSIIGVNTDGETAAVRASSILKERKISFRQLIQTEPALADKYYVQGIPCSVFIDAKGVIQMIHVGMPSEEQLTAIINKLLNGESLLARR